MSCVLLEFQKGYIITFWNEAKWGSRWSRNVTNLAWQYWR